MVFNLACTANSHKLDLIYECCENCVGNSTIWFYSHIVLMFTKPDYRFDSRSDWSGRSAQAWFYLHCDDIVKRQVAQTIELNLGVTLRRCTDAAEVGGYI
jgi:hypothetical protein